MPIRTFDIETYFAFTTQRGTGSVGAWRALRVTSPVLTHGIQHRATLYFFASEAQSPGLVMNVDQPNYQGQTVYAFCRKPDFREWYDILRNEAPLKLSYAYSGSDFDPSDPTRDLFWVEMFTGSPEPPGEGPEEVLAYLFPEAVRAAASESAPTAEGSGERTPPSE